MFLIVTMPMGRRTSSFRGEVIGCLKNSATHQRAVRIALVRIQVLEGMVTDLTRIVMVAEMKKEMVMGKKGNGETDEDNYGRGSGARADDRSQDGSVTGRPLERRFSEQNLSVPPSYEEDVGASRSPTLSERDVEAPFKSYGSGSPSRATVPPPAPAAASPQSLAPAYASPPAPAMAAASPPENKDIASFDEFDPRASF